MNPSSTTLSDAEIEIVRQANILYFQRGGYQTGSWMGYPSAKCPMDMWAYQELMHREQTDLLIETGTYKGGSALYFAQLFDAMGRGQVITIDIKQRQNLPQHPRIRYLTGSSVTRAILEQVREIACQARSRMVILDSRHEMPFKFFEMKLYAEFVTPGNYLIAEDTSFDHYPAWPEFGPGPAAAVHKFLSETPEFEADPEPEKHLLSFSPGAFLRRRAAAFAGAAG
ncbi:CmcI family methyltransferase [Solimonas sp. SE-A11]|uniref:CmcI family methyltransferase n=1 Tax=Solimonas sp. SE-A11 TaxID=3054954 RepID=UPI00259CBA8C|nr:CmcI family methyltransferase [Solimonas sp. SE-A11]MDM4771753.1 CmcI family methyltransferase [Solimonas sp. SE-A11]